MLISAYLADTYSPSAALLRTVKSHSSRKRVTARLPPIWDRLDDSLRLAEAYSQIHTRDGILFTLRLSEQVETSALGASDVTGYLAKRIRRAFRRLSFDVPRYAFSLEVADEQPNRLHLHGAIERANIPDAQLKQALLDAGGLVTGPARARQLKLTKIVMEKGGPRGWARYTRPTIKKTRAKVGTRKIIYIQSRLRKESKAAWDTRRNQNAPQTTG